MSETSFSIIIACSVAGVILLFILIITTYLCHSRYKSKRHRKKMLKLQAKYPPNMLPPSLSPANSYPSSAQAQPFHGTDYKGRLWMSSNLSLYGADKFGFGSASDMEQYSNSLDRMGGGKRVLSEPQVHLHQGHYDSKSKLITKSKGETSNGKADLRRSNSTGGQSNHGYHNDEHRLSQIRIARELNVLNPIFDDTGDNHGREPSVIKRQISESKSYNNHEDYHGLQRHQSDNIHLRQKPQIQNGGLKHRDNQEPVQNVSPRPKTQGNERQMPQLHKSGAIHRNNKIDEEPYYAQVAKQRHSDPVQNVSPRVQPPVNERRRQRMNSSDEATIFTESAFGFLNEYVSDEDADRPVAAGVRPSVSPR